MNTKLSTNRKLTRMLVNILSIVVILAMAFPATGSALAEGEPSPSLAWRDEFDGSLAEPWHWVNENADKWGFNDGFLRIYASPYGSGGENLLLRPVAEGDFMIKTRVLFEPNTNFQFAGLVIWQDDQNFLQLGRAFCDIEGACVGNGIYFDYIGGGTWVNGNFATSISNPSDVFLRLERRGDMVRAFYSADNGISWYEIGTHWIPPDFQVNGVGLTVPGDYNTPDWDIPADFDFFELTEGWGFLPEGFHDYDSGDVPSWACNAGGWAADPDNREADVNVEIVVDHQTVANLTAGDFRQDLLDAGVCVDGNCSFSTSLWGSISSYEPHRVDVWAQDSTGEWVLLSNSAKTITCRTYDIYAYDPLTGTTKLVTTNLRDSDEYDPTWSPNGKKIAHDVVSGDSHQIYVTDVKTGVSAVLQGTEDGGNDAAWSPNGKWIAFDRRWFGEPHIFIVPATGGERILVRENAVSANWAPNGKRIVFQDDMDGSIRTVPVDGGKGGETLVAEFGGLPAWSPDGNWIAYSKDGDIWKVQVNVQGKVLGEPIQLTSGPFGDGKPTWSPDSLTIIYDSGFGQDYDMWSVPAAGGTPTWLTGAPVFGEYGPANARNSSTIAYASFSSDGQAPRLWVAAYTYDPPVGTFDEGTHPYHFDFEWSVPEAGSWSGQGGDFVISDEAEIYDGYVLLRGPEEIHGINYPSGFTCEQVGDINQSQPTRFLIGWLAEPGDEITYSDAKAHFESITATAVWDDGSAELVRHEVIPFREGDWFNYVCTFTEAPPKMDLRVNYGDDWVESFYEAGHSVSLEVKDSEGNVKATAGVVTEPKDFWGGATGFQTQWSDWFDGDGNPMGYPPDIQPNDWVYAQVDNGATAKVQIGQVNGTIDLENNTVEGTVSAPWFSGTVDLECLPWGAPEPLPNISFGSIQPNGSNPFSCSWEGWHIQPGQVVGVGYSGPDGHWVANVISNPYIWAFPEANQVFGYSWPVGSEVSLTINDKYIATVTVEGAPWDANDIMAFFDFNGVHDLVTGDVVMLSGSGMERTHTVQNLAVTEVNVEPDTVSGSADTGAVVHAWVHEFGHDVWIDVTDGTWSTYFGSDVFHLEPGMCGRAEIRVEGNNSTNVDWCIPRPWLNAFPEWDVIYSYEWPAYSDVDLTINGQFVQTVTVGPTSWDPNVYTAYFEFGELHDLKPGEMVTLSGSGMELTYTVQNLAVTAVDETEDTISGTADPNAGIFVFPHATWQQLWVAADGEGNWQVDFTGVFDWVPGECGRAEIRDGLSNSTAVDWCIP